MIRLAIGLALALVASLDAIGQGVGGRIATIYGGAVQPAYTGVVDAIGATVSGCWSTVACKSSTRGQKVFTLCNASDAACVDISTDWGTGLPVVGLVGGTNCAATTTTCTIKTFYDQLGGVGNATQATIANRPTYHATGSPNAPCLQFNNGTSVLVTPALTQAQPYAMGGVTYGNIQTNFPTPWGVNGLSPSCCVMTGWQSTNAGWARLYAGTSVTETNATGNTLLTMDGVFNGASSIWNTSTGGTNSSQNPGTQNLSGTGFGIGALTDGSNSLGWATGRVCEVLFSRNVWSTTNITNKQTNEKSRFGF